MKQMIQTSHCELAVESTDGSGMPVLFIHGNSSCKEIFRNQLQAEIGATFCCIAIDLPGHGESANAKDPEISYTISGYADAILQITEVLQLSAYAVVGWSLGGHIGIEMLSRTDHIRGLAISGTPPIGHDPADFQSGFLPSEHMNLTGKETLTDEEAEKYARATCGSDSHYEDFLGTAVRRTDGRARRIMLEAALRGDGSDQRQIVESNPTSLAVINGTNEEFVNNQYLLQLNFKNLWENNVHLIPDAGHAPFWQAPERFNLLITDFLNSL